MTGGASDDAPGDRDSAPSREEDPVYEFQRALAGEPPPTKSQVDRAGVTLRRWAQRIVDRGDDAAPLPPDVAGAFSIARIHLVGHVIPAVIVHEMLKKAVREVAPGSAEDVTGRQKSEFSLLMKLYKLSVRLTQIEDLWGYRAVLPDQRGVSAVRARLRAAWPDLVEHDYVATPQPTGYRAVHLIVMQNGRPVEVQLRTPRQNEWADEVEKAGDRLGFNRPGTNLKDGEGPADLVEYFRLAATKLAAEENGEPLPNEFAEQFEAARQRARRFYTE